MTQSFQNLPVVLNVISPVLETCQNFCLESQKSKGVPLPIVLDEIYKVKTEIAFENNNFYSFCHSRTISTPNLTMLFVFL